MNQYKKLVNNTLAITIGNFSSKILVFLMLPLYTACLSTSEYGIADLIFTITNLLYPLFTLLANEIALRFTLDKGCDKGTVFSTVLKLHFAGFIILLLLNPLFNFFPSIKDYKLHFYLYYFFVSLSNIVSQFVKGCNSVKLYSIGGLLNTVVTVSLNLLFLLYYNMGIEGYLYAYICGSIVTIIFLFVTRKLYRYINFVKTDFTLLKKMLGYSIPMIPNSICWWVNNSLDRYVLLVFFNTSVLGVYAAANKIPSLLTVFTSIFINAWQISSVDNFGTKQNQDFFSEIYRKYSALVIFVTSGIILFCKPIARILFDESYIHAGDFASILVCAFLFQAMSGFLGTVYTASKKTSTLFISTMAGAGINLIFNFLLIPKYGCYGASIATTISYVFVWIIRLYKSKAIIKLEINLTKDAICYILIALMSIISALAFDFYLLCNALILSIIIYLNYKEVITIVTKFIKRKRKSLD